MVERSQNHNKTGSQKPQNPVTIALMEINHNGKLLSMLSIFDILAGWTGWINTHKSHSENVSEEVAVVFHT